MGIIHKKNRSAFNVLLMSATLLLTGCIKNPQPNNIENACSIFTQNPQWYWASQRAEKNWGVPVAVQMAIIYQESRFNAKAKPPRTKLLWIIPWKRPTSAVGYTQALKGTWQEYKQAVGKTFTNRGRFSDATDFIGWYADQANKRAKIPKEDAYRLYLAYHEGIGGYNRGSYQNKAWLQDVASKVDQRARRYRTQLQQCQRKLRKKPWYRFW